MPPSSLSVENRQRLETEIFTSALTLAVQTNASFFLEEVRETNVSHKAVGLSTTVCIILDGIKDSVTISKRGNRVEHRALGEVVVAADGSDVTLVIRFLCINTRTLIFAVQILEHGKPIGSTNGVLAAYKEGVAIQALAGIVVKHCSIIIVSGIRETILILVPRRTGIQCDSAAIGHPGAGQFHTPSIITLTLLASAVLIPFHAQDCSSIRTIPTQSHVTEIVVFTPTGIFLSSGSCITGHAVLRTNLETGKHGRDVVHRIGVQTPHVDLRGLHTGVKKAGITPLVPEGKDALAILSNNSVAVAYAIEAARNAARVIQLTPTVYGLSLEGLNGNVAPILPQTVGQRPFEGLAQTAADMRAALKGSYLWDADNARPLQDPLSFRVTVYGLSEAKRALKDLNEQITVQINSTDDNPATVLNASEEYRKESSQVAKYFVDGDGVKGGIFPSGNFNPLPVALALQRTSLAMAHLSHYSVQRTIHLSYDQFTGLTRFLSDPDNHGHAFGAIQKAFMGLHVDNMALAQPVSLYGMPVAGEIEDTFTNILQAAKRLNTIDENLFQIYSLEMLHSAQAIDLRRMLKNKDLKLSTPTEGLYKAYRKIVPYVKNDRIFTEDIKNGAELLRTYNLKK